MARDRNTFAKRQRETGKRQKAAEKLIRRKKRKEFGAGDPGAPADARPADPEEGTVPAGP